MTLEDLGASREETALSNGSRLILFKRKAAPLYLEVAFRSGSHLDPLGKEGLAHFTEHMLMGGSEKYPSKESFHVALEQIGGFSNARTGSEALSVVAGIGDPADYAVAIDVISQALQHALFNEKTITTERQSILAELGMVKASPARALGLIVQPALFYQRTNEARSIVGAEETLTSIKRSDLTGFAAEHLGAGKMTVIASGDIELSALKGEFESAFDLGETARSSSSEPIPSVREKPVMVERFAGQEQVHFLLGFRGVPWAHPDYDALAGLASTLGAGAASPLMSKLRWEKGLVYGVGAHASAMGSGGLWTVNGSALKKNMQEVIDLISAEFERTRSGGITQAELDLAKNRNIKSVRLGLQSSQSWVREHAYGELLEPGKKRTVIDELKMIESTTLDDIHRVAKEYLLPGKWYLGMCGDISEDEVTVGF